MDARAAVRRYVRDERDESGARMTIEDEKDMAHLALLVSELGVFPEGKTGRIEEMQSLGLAQRKMGINLQRRMYLWGRICTRLGPQAA